MEERINRGGRLPPPSYTTFSRRAFLKCRATRRSQPRNSPAALAQAVALMAVDTHRALVKGGDGRVWSFVEFLEGSKHAGYRRTGRALRVGFEAWGCRPFLERVLESYRQQQGEEADELRSWSHETYQELYQRAYGAAVVLEKRLAAWALGKQDWRGIFKGLNEVAQ